MIYTLEEAMKQAATRFGTEGHDVSGSFITDGAVVFEGGAWKPNPDAGAGQEPGETRLVVDGVRFTESWCNERVGIFIGRIAESNDEKAKPGIMAQAVAYLVNEIGIALEEDSHG